MNHLSPTRTGEHPIDILVLETGLDAISGTLLRMNPKGRGGVSLAERQMGWIGSCIQHLEKKALGAIEPKPASEEAWGNEGAGLANLTLFPRTDSWWTGANVPGKVA